MQERVARAEAEGVDDMRADAKVWDSESEKGGDDDGAGGDDESELDIEDEVLGM